MMLMITLMVMSMEMKMGMGMHYTDCSDSEIARQSTSSSAEGSEEVDQFPKATSPGMGPHHVLEGSLSSH